jgi:hypothetical protein
MNEELPHDLLLSISRILDLKESPEADPLDTVEDRFNVIDIINRYFPDGVFYVGGNANSITKAAMLFF